MNKQFIYENSDRIERLISELREYPDRTVEVPMGRQLRPRLDRIILAESIFILSFLVCFICMVFVCAFVENILGPYTIVLGYFGSSLIAMFITFFLYQKYKERPLYKKTKIEDLSYTDLARMIAEQDNLNFTEIMKPVEVNENPPSDSNIDGLVFWLCKVQGEGDILPGTPSYKSISEAIKYLKKVKEHESYQPDSTVIEAMTETLRYYDNLVNKEIPTQKVIALRKDIETLMPEFERVSKMMYEEAIDDQILETEIHIKTLQNQFNLKGYSKSDFVLDRENDDELTAPILLKKN